MSNKAGPNPEKAQKSAADLAVDTKIEPKELEEIMSEIDSLQDSMDAQPLKANLQVVPTPGPAAAPANRAATSTSSSEPWLDETLAGYKSDSNDLEKEMEAYEEQAQPPPPASKSAGALSMALQGQMTLHLKYEEKEEIAISFSPEGIQFKFGDGLEFKIPSRLRKVKKVA
jgi:hypothetical protein